MVYLIAEKLGMNGRSAMLWMMPGMRRGSMSNSDAQMKFLWSGSM